MKIDCRELFRDSHLHLLIWDRDSAVHQDGIAFMRHCLSSPGLSGRVMPLLRPAGRKETDYARLDLEFLGGSVGTGLPGLSRTPGNGRLPCCELWLQSAQSVEGALWQELAGWARTHFSGSDWRAWRSHGQALWQPLGTCFSECSYAETATARCHMRTSEALRYLSPLTPDTTAAFLKVLWGRAATVIGLAFKTSDRVPVPSDLLKSMLADIRPEDYGLAVPSGPVDPCMFTASHLTAFAITAIAESADQTAYYPTAFACRQDYFRFIESCSFQAR